MDTDDKSPIPYESTLPLYVRDLARRDKARLVTETTLHDLSVEAIQEQVNILQTQISSLQEEILPNDDIAQKVHEISEAIENLSNQSKELKAKVKLPSPEDMTVRLVSFESLHRLNEYQSDQSILLLVTGALAGGILGVIVNWSTDALFTITKSSVGLLVILLMGLCFMIYWSYILRKRANVLKQKLLQDQDSETEVALEKKDNKSDDSGTSR